uniref:Uncharacterized protein LOC111106520 isoform X2 n=1 Tax=Crassostrea virginica TaxID=6565 RepID=A0A8B8B2U1_CRAVI|nr:uncharacterized protein LOC111106520 isoform X2 [Crassostrea virginica]
MLLAIRSTSERDIDEKDQGNLTASFIAAAYGNDQSLAALVDWGANIHFERSQPLYNDILPHQDPLNVSSYIFQWGYNLANIASQNGHVNVIKVLLKHRINICHENSIGLNSFHLASEHGHTSILRIFISTSKCNWKISFQSSLYLASKNGHLNVVAYLLSLNAVDKCVHCSDTMYWIPKGKVRLQSNFPYQKMPNWYFKNFVLKEDTQLFFCQSALDIAVQNRHFDIVKILANETVNALKCINARGMTPLITAAAFEHDDIVLYFLQARYSLNDTCREMQKSRFNIDNNEQSGDRLCVKGLSFWHMLAIYASEKLWRSS